MASTMLSTMLPIATVWVPVPLRVHLLSFRWRSDGVASLRGAWAQGRGCVPSDACSLVLFCIRLVRRAVGSWFRFYRGVPGVGGGRAEEVAGPAWPGYELRCGGEGRLGSLQRRHLPHRPAGPRSGQVKVGAGVLRLGPRRGTGASRQQLLPVPSPEAREPASGSWMGQMAGDRLGGTAEWWEVGSGHLARPLATQLFTPHGGWERPQQQAEAKLGGEEDGPPPPQREPAQGEEPGSARL